ncbi:MAG: hypothetical protein QM771_07180 [Nitrospira sp.]
MRIPNISDYTGRSLPMPTVQDATEFFLRVTEGIHFINQQGRMSRFDCAEDHGGRDIGRGEGSGHQLADQFKQGGFPATLLG